MGAPVAAAMSICIMCVRCAVLEQLRGRRARKARLEAGLKLRAYHSLEPLHSSLPAMKKAVLTATYDSTM